MSGVPKPWERQISILSKSPAVFNSFVVWAELLLDKLTKLFLYSFLVKILRGSSCYLNMEPIDVLDKGSVLASEEFKNAIIVF